MGKRAFYAAMGIVGIVAGLVRPADANVFDDAVFWFRGGKDHVTVNGQLDKGEFFDDLHANDPTHTNHTLAVYGYPENRTFRTEPVVFPAFGTSVTQDLQVLHIDNIPHISADGTVTNRYPAWVCPYHLFKHHNISNEYTIIFRVRRDPRVGDLATGNQWLTKIAYTGSNGLLVGFTGDEATTNKHVMSYRIVPNGTNSGAELGNLLLPSNTWADVSVVAGNGKLRVGIALPRLVTYKDNSMAFRFSSLSLDTDRCKIAGGVDNYTFFSEGTAKSESTSASVTGFRGSVQQLAVWKRALSDQEVAEAFGMPRPSVFRVGLDNDASNEFGGERASSSQTLNSSESWRELTNEMRAGDTWTANFTVPASENGLTQMFFFKALPASSAASLRVAVNGAIVGVKSVLPGRRSWWPVPHGLIRAGANTLTVTRTDSGTGSVLMDSMALGGSFQTGTANSNMDDLVGESRFVLGLASSAMPNPKQWSRALTTYSNGEGTNFLFHVWVDPTVQRLCTARFSTRVATAAVIAAMDGSEKLHFKVNGVEKYVRLRNPSGWSDMGFDFEPGELNAGWNDVHLVVESDARTGYFAMDYYRFEIGLPLSGTYLILR